MQPRINLNISTTCNLKITPWKFEIHLLYHVYNAVLQSSPLSPLLQAAININELLEKDTQVFRPKGSSKVLWVSPSDACWMMSWMGQASKKAFQPAWNCCEVLVDAAADVIFSRNLAGDVYKFKQHWHWCRRCLLIFTYWRSPSIVAVVQGLQLCS